MSLSYLDMVIIISYLKVNVIRPKVLISANSCTSDDELPGSEYESFNGNISLPILMILISYLKVNISLPAILL